MKIIKQQKIINEIKEKIDANPHWNFILSNVQALRLFILNYKEQKEGQKAI